MKILDEINLFFNIDSTVSVPIIISLIVFIVGGISKLFFEYINRTQKRKNTRHRFISIIEKVIDDVEVKEKVTKEFYPNIRIDYTEDWLYKYRPISYLETVYLLDFNVIHNSFYYKFKSLFRSSDSKEEAFHNIWDALSRLKFLESKLEENLEGLQNNFKEFHDKYRDSLSGYRDLREERIADYILNNISTYDKDLIRYLEKEKEYWDKWVDLDEEKRIFSYMTYKHLVHPMYLLNQEFQDLYLALQSGKFIVDCEQNYAEMMNVLSFYQNQFKDYYNQYKYISDKLSDNLKIIIQSHK